MVLYRLRTKFQIRESHSIENTMIGNKRSLKDDQSYLLWHQKVRTYLERESPKTRERENPLDPLILRI